MKWHLILPTVVAAIISATATPTEVMGKEAASWIFRRSTYSHSPVTGERVSQYASPRASIVRSDNTYRESGYRHIRSSLRGPDGSADRTHVVQTWGAGESIRPYGEWQRPFRDGATPYGPWGNAQGPWTKPFESWDNPYGQWNRYPYGYRSAYPNYGGGPVAVPYATPYGSPGGMPHGGSPGGGSPHGGPHGP
jgi:hypothetical protein